MSDVYANGREISAKKDSNKSLCAMPDVCLSPPSPPAGPIPIPYPNTAKASNTTSGSKSVKIGGKEVGLKNKSAYKKSMGDEAATKSLGMGVVSHNIQGPMKHAAWSMDVKIEGKNAIRHMDLTLHNYSNPSQPALVSNQAKQKIARSEELNCDELDALNQEARSKEKRPGAKGGFTTTTASFKSPGRGRRSKFMKAMTPQDAIKSGKRSGYAPPNKKQGMACKKKKWGEDSPRFSEVESNKARNHTEPKLIEAIFRATGPLGRTKQPPGSLGTLKMKIHHKEKGKRADAMPCPSCKKGICAAVDCGLNIILCSKKNEEVNAKKLCDNGNPKPKSEWKVAGL